MSPRGVCHGLREHLVSWREIDLGRPIQGPDYSPVEGFPRATIDVAVAANADTDEIRLTFDNDGDPAGRVVLDRSNAYALFSALGIALTGSEVVRPVDCAVRKVSGH